MEKVLNTLIHNKHTVHIIVNFFQKVGRLEQTIPLEQKLPTIPESTLSVLTAQVDEILTTEFEIDPQKYETPCYFAMSVYDPLLRFDTTLEIMQNILSM